MLLAHPARLQVQYRLALPSRYLGGPQRDAMQVRLAMRATPSANPRPRQLREHQLTPQALPGVKRHRGPLWALPQ
jgi:hypothetical protein